MQSLAANLVAAGQLVTIVTLGGSPADEMVDGVRIIRLSDWMRVGDVLSFPLPGATRRITRLLRRAGVSVVSTHTRFFPMTFVGVRAARRLGVPVVHTEHGSGFVKGVNPVVGVASRLVDVTAGRYALRQARLVLAVSEQVAAFVERLSGARAGVFYNAVDIDRWRKAAGAPRARLVYVGRLVSGKGWRELLIAASTLRAQGTPRFEVAIYGDGPERGALLKGVEEYGLGDVVTVHGQVDSDELAAGVAGAILVNPTTLSEGFQTSIIEVLAAGGRVVSYEVAGVGVLAADGAPVRIVGKSHDELVEAISAELSQPSPPYTDARLEHWGWRQRTLEYARVLDRVSGSAES